MFDERTSVVIATRNRATELKRTVVELMSLDPTPQVVVVDNASTDDTGPQMRALAAGCPHVHYRRLRGDEGAAARNAGVRSVTTPYVAFADDDSWWERGALTRAADLFDAHPRLGLVAARALVGDEPRPDPVNEVLARSPLGTPEGLPGPTVLDFRSRAAVVRRSAYDQAGGFSGTLRHAGQERLLAYGLAAHGWHLCYADDVVARHRPSRERPSTARHRVREMRDAALVSWHRRPFSVCLRDMRPLAAAALRDRSAAAALAELLARLPSVLSGRRRLPAEVEAAIVRLETAEAARR